MEKILQENFIRKVFRMKVDDELFFIQLCFDKLEKSKFFFDLEDIPIDSEVYQILLYNVQQKINPLVVKHKKEISFLEKSLESYKKTAVEIEQELNSKLKEQKSINENMKEIMNSFHLLSKNLEIEKCSDYVQNHLDFKLKTEKQKFGQTEVRIHYTNYGMMISDYILNKINTFCEELEQRFLLQEKLLLINHSHLKKFEKLIVHTLSESVSKDDALLNIQVQTNKIIEKIKSNIPSLSNQEQIQINQQKQELIECRNFERNVKPQLLKKLEAEKLSLEKVTHLSSLSSDLKKRKQEIFDSPLDGIDVRKLSWKFLPKGKWTIEDIIKFFREKKYNKGNFDESRLMKIQLFLKPTMCYIGEGDFEGYVVFCFDRTKKVILECPKFGNAIYVINGNWQEITKLSKWEVRNLYSKQVTVINHNDTWLERLARTL